MAIADGTVRRFFVARNGLRIRTMGLVKSRAAYFRKVISRKLTLLAQDGDITEIGESAALEGYAEV